MLCFNAELIIGVNGITPLDPNNGTIQLQEGKLCVDKLSGECFHLEKRNAIYQMTWNGSGFQGLCLNFQEFTARAKQNCIDELTLPNGKKTTFLYPKARKTKTTKFPTFEFSRALLLGLTICVKNCRAFEKMLKISVILINTVACHGNTVLTNRYL